MMMMIQEGRAGDAAARSGLADCCSTIRPDDCGCLAACGSMTKLLELAVHGLSAVTAALHVRCSWHCAMCFPISDAGHGLQSKLATDGA
jgi:hypothetical protein